MVIKFHLINVVFIFQTTKMLSLALVWLIQLRLEWFKTRFLSHRFLQCYGPVLGRIPGLIG
jgi:hypothetical protein